MPITRVLELAREPLRPAGGSQLIHCVRAAFATALSGDLTGVLRETPVAPVGRVGVGGAACLAEPRRRDRQGTGASNVTPLSRF